MNRRSFLSTLAALPVVGRYLKAEPVAEAAFTPDSTSGYIHPPPDVGSSDQWSTITVTKSNGTYCISSDCILSGPTVYLSDGTTTDDMSVTLTGFSTE